MVEKASKVIQLIIGIAAVLSLIFLTSWNSRLGTAEVKIDNHGGRIIKLETDFSNLEKRLDAIDKKLDRLLERTQ